MLDERRAKLFRSGARPCASRSCENLVEAFEHAVGAGRVEALAVVIDDPPAVANVVLIGLDQTFVDIAFIEFGVADQRDEAAAVSLIHLAMGGEIILHQAGKSGDRDSSPTEPVEKSTGILSLVRLG